MTILAIYYTLADIVLLGQCFYYHGFTITEELSICPTPESTLVDNDAEYRGTSTPSEQSSLLPKPNGNDHAHVQEPTGSEHIHHHAQDGTCMIPSSTAEHRRHSATSFHDFLHPSVDVTHLSPATPFIEPSHDHADGTQSPRPRRRITALQTSLFNTAAIALVCAAGILGWFISPSSKTSEPQPDSLIMDPLGQVFGYLCAVLYLGSRLPQLLLNFRRKSTEGVSLLFFLFACIGNLTYVLSILAYWPVCREGLSLTKAISPRHRLRCRPGEEAGLYGRYVLVNLSWLIGSLGTLLLDMAIFAQFFLYRNAKEDDDEECFDQRD